MPREPNDDSSPTSGATAPLGPASAEDPLLGAIAKALGERAGDQIGPYRLLSPIGEGGFGVVWLAERREPMVQRVALKIIKPGMDSKSVIARFEAERQALAVMDHPGIAKVFDAGATPAGRPYFVMEHIQGEPITAYCDRQRLTNRQRLRLFCLVCDAVQHAHMKGIIHRDLKPSNILVGLTDGGEPRPVVIDFGVAKALAQRLTERTLFTERGQLIGTPEYMSPEQAEMSETGIDTRTDVYALGVVLYELLTGALPFDPRTLREAGYAAIQKMIREIEAPRPSARLSTMGAGSRKAAEDRHVRLDDLAAELRSELEWIPLKALRKDRTERYRSAAELGDDVSNYLASRPLIAGPLSAAYRARKFVRRNRAAVAAAAAMVVLLVGGLVGTGIGLAWALREADRAEREAAAAERVSLFLNEDLLQSVDPEIGGPETRVVDILAAARARLGGRFADEPLVQARIMQTLGEAYLSVGQPKPAKELLDSALDLMGSSGDPAVREAIENRRAEAGYRLNEGPELIEALRRQVADATARRGARDRETMNLRNQLGGALMHGGQLDAAEDVYRQVLADRQGEPGIPPVDVLITRHDLNLIALRRGRALKAAQGEAAARAAFAAALEERRLITADTLRSLGADHPQTLASRAEELGLIAESGRTEDAIAGYPPLLESMRSRLGLSHWRTLETTARYGRALMRAARPADAADQLLMALEAYRFIRPRTFPDTLLLVDWTADCLEKSGSEGAAGAILERMYSDLAEGGAAADLLRTRACGVRDFYRRTGRETQAAAWQDRCGSP